MAASVQIAQESELQSRSRIITNYFKERHNCIVLKLDTHINDEKGINPFGFHFELDYAKYYERKRQIKREAVTQWLAWLADVHHRLGFRHLLLLLMMAVYVLLGGLVFLAIEQQHEMESFHKTVAELVATTKETAQKVENITLLERNAALRERKLITELKMYYIKMLGTEGRFSGSTYHKEQNLILHRMWTFSNSVFYALTVFTTLGYGTIVCGTWFGRWVTVVYAAFGIPLMLLTLGDLGQLIRNGIVRGIIAFRQMRQKWRRKDIEGGYKEGAEGGGRNRSSSSSSSYSSSSGSSYSSSYNSEDRESLLEQPPIWLVLSIIFIYIMATTTFVWLFDYDENGKKGIDFQESLYFVIISVSTVGFGDIMPKHIQYSAVMALAFVFGLALASILNVTLFAKMYTVFYNGVMNAEEKLERIHQQKRITFGHRIFRDLEPAIKTLVLSFPHFESRPKDMVSKYRLPEVFLLDQWFTPQEVRFARSESECVPPRAQPSHSHSHHRPHSTSHSRRNHAKIHRTRSEKAPAGSIQRPARSRERSPPPPMRTTRIRAPTLGAFGCVEVKTRSRRGTFLNPT